LANLFEKEMSFPQSIWKSLAARPRLPLSGIHGGEKGAKVFSLALLAVCNFQRAFFCKQKFAVSLSRPKICAKKGAADMHHFESFLGRNQCLSPPSEQRMPSSFEGNRFASAI